MIKGRIRHTKGIVTYYQYLSFLKGFIFLLLIVENNKIEKVNINYSKLESHYLDYLQVDFNFNFYIILYYIIVTSSTIG